MNFATSRNFRAALGLAFFSSMLAAQPAHADSLTVTWDPNPEQVTGYVVYLGTQSGALTQRNDVGPSTTFTWSSAIAGQLYCVQVSAYANTIEGPRSAEVCGYTNQFPILVNPGSRTSSVGQSVTLQLAGSDPDSDPISYSANGLPPGLTLMGGTGFISGSPTVAGSYPVTASVSDGVLTSAPQTFTWSVSPAAPADTTAPAVSITAPTAAATFTAPAASMSLSGIASDSVGVATVMWANNRGGSGTATGTTSWGVPSIGLQSGSNVITVTARDAAGNQGTDTITVTYTAPDSTVPNVSITGPTSSSTYSTSSALTLSGTASDNVGVTQVSWTNDRGGSGTASGTANWGVASIALQAGTNVITVTARDAAANQSTDTLTVTYTAPDTSAPAVTFLGPTTASTYTTTSSVLTIGGTASDDRGVTAVSWSNDRGGTGFTSGTTSWSVATVALQSGTNVITVTAQDAAGNRGTDVLTVTSTPPPDTTTPALSITGPTSSTTYSTTSASVALSGTASDNVGVTRVTWSNDRGGSGTATGTTAWSIPTVALQAGTNVVSVVARDAAGNAASDVLTITYSAPTSSGFVLSATPYSGGSRPRVLLQWSGASGRFVDIYRDSVRLVRVNNNGSATDSPRTTGTISYRLCVTGGTTVCSNTVSVTVGQ